ncbi:MAG: thiamine phosphate synthase [Pirellulaceae bacterium]|nr:thiamine phosphate synthase [Pirellulaceae bacterium]
MQFTFTAAAERVLDHAAKWPLSAEAVELQAESLLLGLLAEPECRAAVMLGRVNVDVAIVRREWPGLRQITPPAQGRHCPPFSSNVDCSLRLAADRLPFLPRPIELATEHILLGLAAADHEVACWLRRHGIDPDQIAAEIRALHGSPPDDYSSVPIDADDAGEYVCDPTLNNNNNNNKGNNSRGALSPSSCGNHVGEIAALRIIDAAANRAREGLRVVEDFARLTLDDRHLTELCKQLRHDLVEALLPISVERRLAARETRADVGTSLDAPSEARRETPADVLTANFSRAEESLRSLEEFCKLLDPAAAAAMKQLRYRTYTLQRAVCITDHARRRLVSARLYVLLDGRATPEEFQRLVHALIGAGTDVLQLRDKRLDDRGLLDRAGLLAAAARAAGVLAIVNDRPDIAVLAGADGVHVGQEEMPVADARRVVGPDALVGVSTHSLDQARQAVLDGADYIGVGPVFPSETKQFAAYPGLEFVRAVSAEIGLPSFAIGGISPANLHEVLAAGAMRVAVGAAVTAAPDPAAAARQLRKLLTGRAESP